MKKYIIAFFLTISCFGKKVNAQIGVRFDPSVQPTQDMQYFRPTGNLNVGDCMPFYHNGLFSLFWLVDSLHGENLQGLGGHQWVVSTSRDLKSWTHHPIAIGIDQNWEKSICTGSVAYYDNKYYAFYATRLLNNGNINEQLSYAVSSDGLHFDKQQPNPFYTSAPGYSQRNFRDPKVFVDKKGVFHLFVASEQNDPALNHAAGCLVHLSSKDLKAWTVHEPILTGQPSVPECPDYFFWKGWYYLMYSDNSNTYYVKSRNPYGPWQEPKSQTLNEDWSNVVKTAAFKDDRRIAVGWIPDRRDNKDDAGEIFGGSAVFRELKQLSDGTLATEFPEEMIPKTSAPLNRELITDLYAKHSGKNGVIIEAPNGTGAAHLTDIPLNCRITMEVEPIGNNAQYGLYLHADKNAQNGYRLNLSAQNHRVSLANTNIEAVDGLEGPVKLDIVIRNGIIDVCIDNKRTIVNRTYEQQGKYLYLYAKHGKVAFKSILIRPLLEK